jgi:hypothetical protein
MTKKELRSLMQEHILDARYETLPKVTLLNRMMKDVEAYADQQVMNYTTKGVHVYSDSDITKSGPYWDKVNSAGVEEKVDYPRTGGLSPNTGPRA